jgi:hypothetical protein
MKVLLIVIMSLCAWGITTVSAAPPLDIPVDVRDAVNQQAFLAAVAQRCDVALTRGKAGLTHDACRELERKFLAVMTRMHTHKDTLLRLAATVDTTQSAMTKWEGEAFLRQWITDTQTIVRAIDHLRFVRE